MSSGRISPAASSSSSIEWNGPRRRCVGDPGLRIQAPACRSTTGRCVWPKSTASHPGSGRGDGLRARLPAPGCGPSRSGRLRRRRRAPSAGARAPPPRLRCREPPRPAGRSRRAHRGTRRTRDRPRGGSGRRGEECSRHASGSRLAPRGRCVSEIAATSTAPRLMLRGLLLQLLVLLRDRRLRPRLRGAALAPPVAVVPDFDGDQLTIWPEQAERPAAKRGADAP